jgi:hypothetical protein
VQRSAVIALLITAIASAQTKPKPPKSPRLYVIDCGVLTMSAPQLFGFTKEEVGEKQPFAVPCYLVVHPKGTLLWDVGIIPDARINGATREGDSTVSKTLKASLAEIGYSAKDINYLGLSPPALGPHRKRQRLCRIDMARPSGRA